MTEYKQEMVKNCLLANAGFTQPTDAFSFYTSLAVSAEHPPLQEAYVKVEMEMVLFKSVDFN